MIGVPTDNRIARFNAAKKTGHFLNILTADRIFGGKSKRFWP
jgi:hypothetical protein